MSKKTEKILIGLSCIFVMFVIIPIIMAAFLMFPSADDFSNTNSVIATGGNIFFNTLKLSKASYLGWQGTYFSIVLVYFFSNLIMGSIIGYRIVCIVNIILLLSGIYYLVHIIFQEIIKEYRNYVVNFVFCITVFMVTLGHYVDEALYWFTGVCVYTIPLACSIWGIAFLIKYNFKPEKKLIYAAGILLFCGVGGALQITALTCGILLGIVIITIRQKKNHNLIVFLISLVGGFINALAPGYYLRHEKLDDEFHISEAVISAAKSAISAMKMQLSSTIIVLCLIILIGIGYYFGKKSQNEICLKHILGVAIYLGIGLVVVDFPVYLGYGTYFPSRCLFVENVAVTMTFMTLAIMIGIWLSKILIIQKKNIVMLVTSIVLVLFFVLRIENFEMVNYPILNICYNWSNGNLSRYVDDNTYIYGQLEEGEGKDLVFESLPNCMGIYPQIGIYENLDMWTNKTIAKFYSVNSIRKQN